MHSATTKPTTNSLGDQLDGRVIGPADPEYDKERAIWNGMIDRRPGAIARCDTTADAASPA
jgi:hypothetical protein